MHTSVKNQYYIICVYSTFLIKRAIVVEPTSLIASPSFCAHFFHFLQSSPLFSLLFQSRDFNYFSPRCEFCMTAFAWACHCGILVEMICINDGWWWRGDDEREENDMRQKERRSCQEKCGWWASDHGSNEAHPIFYLLDVYLLFICPSEWFNHTGARSLSVLKKVCYELTWSGDWFVFFFQSK